MKKLLFLLTFVLFSNNIQLNKINEPQINYAIERKETIRDSVYGDTITFEDVNINLTNLIGIEGNWFGTNHIVFDINEEFKIDGREFITLILKDYNTNPYLEIAFFYDSGELKTKEYILHDSVIDSIQLNMVNKNDNSIFKEEFEYLISYKNNFLSRVAIENEDSSDSISTYSTFNSNVYAASEMTKSNAYVKQYVDSEIMLIEEADYYGKYDTNNRYTQFDDNSIVNIIPKQYFKTIGSNYYFGSEYGFYINTYKYNNRDDLYQSNFIVITYDHSRGDNLLNPASVNGSFENNVISFELVPMINGFVYYDVIYDTVYGFEGGSNLCVDNIEFEYGTRNRTEANLEDEDFLYANDKGMYSNLFVGEINGEGKNSDKTNIYIDGLKYIFNKLVEYTDPNTKIGMAIEMANTAINFVDDLDSAIFDIKAGMYENNNGIIIDEDGTAKMKFYNFYNFLIDQYQIGNYANHPCKGFTINYLNKESNSYDDNYPLLLKNINHNYLINYYYYPLDGTETFEQLYAEKISFYIKQDNSLINNNVSYILNSPIIKSWQVKYDYNSLNNSSNIPLYNIGSNSFVEYSGGTDYTYLKFIPQSDGYHYFKTNGYPSDTTVDLLNSAFSVNNNKRVSYVKHSTSSSTYIYDLTEGVTYYFRFKNDNGFAGCTNFFGGYYDVPLEENDYTGNYSEYSAWNYEMQIFDFVPKSTDRYLIVTSNLEPGEYVDTYLEIYNSSFKRIAYSNDVITPTGTSINAEIEICLKQGETYYICTKPNTVRHDVEYYSINIMRMRTISGDTEFLNYPAQYIYSVDTTTETPYMCIKVKPEVTGNYRFEITGSNNNNYVMSLWGDSYSFVKFNSEYSSGTPYIVNTLYNDTVYFVFIQQKEVLGNLTCNFSIAKI